MNPALRQLGFAAADRVVVVHADDVGMCGATVGAFFDLAAAGAVSSGSAMVPCPWFPEVAARCRENPEVDLGVHLTLTCEWDGYRWGPVSTCDPASGLIDRDGYFYRDQDRWRAVDPEAARREMAAQVDRALAAGIDVTHLDCHMFAILHAGLAGPYVDLGLARGVPPLLTRERGWVETLSTAAIGAWEERGVPVFDHLAWMPLDGPAEDRVAMAKRLFDELPAGLSYLLTHPARDTPELRAIASDWRQRAADFAALASAELRRHVRRSGVQVVGWRPFRDLLRARTPVPTLAAPAVETV